MRTTSFAIIAIPINLASCVFSAARPDQTLSCRMKFEPPSAPMIAALEPPDPLA